MKLYPALLAVVGILIIIMLYDINSKNESYLPYVETKEVDEVIDNQFYIIDNKLYSAANMDDDQRCLSDMFFNKSPLTQSQWCTKVNVDDIKLMKDMSKVWYKIDTPDVEMISVHSCNKNDGSLLTTGECDPVIETIRSFSRIKHPLNPHINDNKK